MISKKFHLKNALTAAALALSFAFPAAAAVNVNGYKFEDTIKVAGKDLKLNGAGMRIKVVVQVYAAGLYVPEKKTNAADILKEAGPRRVSLQMARDITSDEFGKAFMDGMNDNIEKSERQRYLPQIGKMAELFASVDGLKKGDVLTIDWIPGAGTIASINGKKLSEGIPDVGFYNAILRIWIGDKAVDKFLKPALLGEPKQDDR